MIASQKLLAPAFIDLLRAEFVLDWRGLHGVAHWARVRHNGLALARANGAPRA